MENSTSTIWLMWMLFSSWLFVFVVIMKACLPSIIILSEGFEVCLSQKADVMFHYIVQSKSKISQTRVCSWSMHHRTNLMLSAVMSFFPHYFHISVKLDINQITFDLRCTSYQVKFGSSFHWFISPSTSVLLHKITWQSWNFRSAQNRNDS